MYREMPLNTTEPSSLNQLNTTFLMGAGGSGALSQLTAGGDKKVIRLAESPEDANRLLKLPKTAVKKLNNYGTGAMITMIDDEEQKWDQKRQYSSATTQYSRVAAVAPQKRQMLTSLSGLVDD